MPDIIKWSIRDDFQEIGEEEDEVMESGGWKVGSCRLKIGRLPMHMSDVCGQTRRENQPTPIIELC